MAEFSKIVVEDYGIKRRPITACNPQANVIIERVHQTIGNIIRTLKPQNQPLDEENPWDGILAATMFAIRATFHTTLQATPSQLVFGRDAILNTTFEANWKQIKERKQSVIHKNNKAENKKRIAHEYQAGDQVLCKNLTPNKYGQSEYQSPFTLSRVNNSGTVYVNKGYCTIVPPWGKYEYQRLPMGLCNSPDIFQEEMGTLMQDLSYVRTYIDDLLVITKSTFESHLHKLDEVLTRLDQAGLKVNAKKSFFAQQALEYLGFWVTRQGIQPMPNKIQAMQDIAPPTNKRQLR